MKELGHVSGARKIHRAAMARWRARNKDTIRAAAKVRNAKIREELRRLRREAGRE